MRPKSIEQFSLVYGAIILIGVLNTWLGWDDMMAQVSMQQMIAQFGMGSVWTVIVVGVLIQLLLWYFITQRRSAVAKWIFVVWFTLSVLVGLWGLVVGGANMTVLTISSVLLLVLEAYAMWLLFRPDTPAWFGEAPTSAA